MKDLLDRAVLKRESTLLEQIRAIFVARGADVDTPAPVLLFEEQLKEIRAQLPPVLREESSREIWAYPAQFDPQRYPWENLETICSKATVRYRDVGMPLLFIPSERPGQRREIGLINEGIRMDMIGHRMFWQFMTSGLFYHHARLRIEGTIDTDSLWKEIAMGIDTVVGLYEGKIKATEEVTFGIRFYGIKDWRLTSARDEEIYLRNFQARESLVEHVRTLPLAEIKAGKIDLAAETYKRFCHYFGFDSASANAVKPYVQQMMDHRYH